MVQPAGSARRRSTRDPGRSDAPGRVPLRARGQGLAAPACRRLSALAFALWLVLAAGGARPAQAAARVATFGAVTIEIPAERPEALTRLAADAPAIVDAVQGDLRVRFAAPVRVVLIPPGVRWHATEPPLDSTLNRLDAEVPAWAAGWAIPGRRLVAIRIAESSRWPYGTVAGVLAHELTHVLAHDAVGRALPRWLDEGIATWTARRFGWTDAVAVSTALMARPLPAFARLDPAFAGDARDAQAAYAAAFAFMAWSVRRYGDAFPARLLAETRGRPWEDAWLAASGERFAFAERAWRRSALLAFRWVPVLGGSALLWGAISLGFAAAGVRRRRAQLDARARLPDDPEWVEPVADDAPVQPEDRGPPVPR